ncbi:MAG: hypothetical protein IPJ05_09980 [Nitrosomonas sp.]|nr:hypothetical protein [Nitrosomonas sp.]
MVTRGRKFHTARKQAVTQVNLHVSLVNELEEPTLWSEGEGRWMGGEITEVSPIDFRGSRVGMF